MSNSWNAFQKSYVKQHGSTSKTTLSKMYRQQHGAGAAGAARKSPKRSARSLSPKRRARSLSPKRRSPQKSPNLKKIYSKLSPSQRYKRHKVRSMIGREHEGRGSPTRGWIGEAPQKGAARHHMTQKCGSKAFLGKNEKYPVMAAGGKCEYSCRGLSAAYNRARQQHNEPIAKKALALKSKHCSK